MLRLILAREMRKARGSTQSITAAKCLFERERYKCCHRASLNRSF
jgi:hypothetical protein